MSPIAPETTCGRRATKRIYCWGRDNNGQVGNGPGSFGNVDAPVQVAGNHADWASVSTGGYHTCGRRGGKVYCWGENWRLQLGVVGPSGSAMRQVPLPPAE